MKTIFVTLLAFTLLLLSCIKDEKEDVINYIEENDKLPEFTVKNATGEELHSEDLSGNTTLLVFFVTTCGDCKRELPKIDSVWNELKDQPTFRLVTISRGETAEVVNAFWKEQNRSIRNKKKENEIFSAVDKKSLFTAVSFYEIQKIKNRNNKGAE